MTLVKIYEKSVERELRVKKKKRSQWDRLFRDDSRGDQTAMGLGLQLAALGSTTLRCYGRAKETPGNQLGQMKEMIPMWFPFSPLSYDPPRSFQPLQSSQNTFLGFCPPTPA